MRIHLKLGQLPFLISTLLPCLFMAYFHPVATSPVLPLHCLVRRLQGRRLTPWSFTKVSQSRQNEPTSSISPRDQKRKWESIVSLVSAPCRHCAQVRPASNYKQLLHEAAFSGFHSTPCGMSRMVGGLFSDSSATPSYSQAVRGSRTLVMHCAGTLGSIVQAMKDSANADAQVLQHCNAELVVRNCVYKGALTTAIW